jgi:GH15 family glucan-1,4-alpha-glucosidase
LYDKYGSPIGYDTWANVLRLMEWVSANWRQPDEGIWEVRGGRQEFLFSRVMCWVAIDRAIRLATKRSFPAPLERWYVTRDAIYQDVFTRFWNPTRGAFMQYAGATTLDAAALLMPLVRFVSPTDPRWVSTLRAIERELVSDSLVYRYRLASGFSDGLTGDEGTFSMCSFWYVECLSRMGDLHQARFSFEKMLGYANHLGLYGEELGPRPSTSAASPRRSRTWHSSAPHSISTVGFRPPATPRNCSHRRTASLCDLATAGGVMATTRRDTPCPARQLRAASRRRAVLDDQKLSVPPGNQSCSKGAAIG